MLFSYLYAESLLNNRLFLSFLTSKNHVSNLKRYLAKLPATYFSGNIVHYRVGGTNLTPEKEYAVIIEPKVGNYLEIHDLFEELRKIFDVEEFKTLVISLLTPSPEKAVVPLDGIHSRAPSSKKSLKKYLTSFLSDEEILLLEINKL